NMSGSESRHAERSRHASTSQSWVRTQVSVNSASHGGREVGCPATGESIDTIAFAQGFDRDFLDRCAVTGASCHEHGERVRLVSDVEVDGLAEVFAVDLVGDRSIASD